MPLPVLLGSLWVGLISFLFSPFSPIYLSLTFSPPPSFRANFKQLPATIVTRPSFCFWFCLSTLRFSQNHFSLSLSLYISLFSSLSLASHRITYLVPRKSLPFTRRAATFHALTSVSSSLAIAFPRNRTHNTRIVLYRHLTCQHINCKCPSESFSLASSPIRHPPDPKIYADFLPLLPATPHAVVLHSPLSIATADDQRLSILARPHRRD